MATTQRPWTEAKETWRARCSACGRGWLQTVPVGQPVAIVCCGAEMKAERVNGARG